MPGNFVAMRCPIHIPGGRAWKDEQAPDGGFSHREFSAEHYVETLQELGVQAVVRLNEARYDGKVFEDASM